MNEELETVILNQVQGIFDNNELEYVKYEELGSDSNSEVMTVIMTYSIVKKIDRCIYDKLERLKSISGYMIEEGNKILHIYIKYS